MRRILVTALVLGGISVSVMALSKTVRRTETNATKDQFHSGMATYGLRVSLPSGMKNFPVELVPLD
jgi:hypothetical protein